MNIYRIILASNRHVLRLFGNFHNCGGETLVDFEHDQDGVPGNEVNVLYRELHGEYCHGLYGEYCDGLHGE